MADTGSAREISPNSEYRQQGHDKKNKRWPTPLENISCWIAGAIVCRTPDCECVNTHHEKLTELHFHVSHTKLGSKQTEQVRKPAYR